MDTTKSLPAPEKRLEKSVEISTLCAFYGGLLTERQRTALQLHYGEDWSLSEIADHLSVSRQNVHDLITRSAQKLRHCEKAVGGIAQMTRAKARLHAAVAELEAAGTRIGGAAGLNIAEALHQIKQTIEDIDGEE